MAVVQIQTMVGSRRPLLLVRQIPSQYHHLVHLVGIPWLPPRHKHLGPRAFSVVIRLMGTVFHMKHHHSTSDRISSALQVFSSRPHRHRRVGMKFAESDQLPSALLDLRCRFPPFRSGHISKRSVITPAVIWARRSLWIGSIKITSRFWLMTGNGTESGTVTTVAAPIRRECTFHLTIGATSWSIGTGIAARRPQRLPEWPGWRGGDDR